MFDDVALCPSSLSAWLWLEHASALRFPTQMHACTCLCIAWHCRANELIHHPGDDKCALGTPARFRASTFSWPGLGHYQRP